MKQTYRCNTKECHNETRCDLPNVPWLEIVTERCANCGRDILFSTLYNPVLDGGAIWRNGRLTIGEKVKTAKIRTPNYSTEASQEGLGQAKFSNPTYGMEKTA